MNNRVTVTGMEVKTRVSDNLLIAGDTYDSTARKGENEFVNSLNQSVKGILEPVSTIDGNNFYYTSTSNAKASGDAINEEYIPYANYTGAYTEYGLQTGSTGYVDKFSENYNITTTSAGGIITGETSAKGYVDYVFQLKALNTTSSAQQIALTKLRLTSENPKDLDQAFRVAIFVEDITASNPTAGTATEVPGTQRGLYRMGTSRNFSELESTPTVKAVSSTSALSAITYTSSATAIASPVANRTSYYKVVVRLWLEGEDTTCNNETFMALTERWTLDLEMKLQNDLSDAVTSLQFIRKGTVGATTYYYDGTTFWTDEADIGNTSAGTATATADTAVKEAFGIPTT